VPIRISQTATALPAHYYPQSVLIEAFRKHWGGRLDPFSVLEKRHAAAQVDGRYLALPFERYPFKNWGEANNCWIEASSN
jgi:predicted naringenin-chalcone synthase